MGILRYTGFFFLAGLAYAQAPLQCRPIATTAKQFPQICLGESYREELAAYINAGEIFTMNGIRIIDRIELWQELSENQFVLGDNLVTLRLNAYLRTRDLKDLLNQIRPRLNLIHASPEISSKYKLAVKQSQEVRLNLNCPMNRLLDEPFVGPGAIGLMNAVVADKISTPTPQVESEFIETKSETRVVTPPPPTPQEICQKDIAALIEKKDSSEDELKGLQKSIASLDEQVAQEEGLLTSSLSQKKGKKHQSLSELAESVDQSDCDRCTDALKFCKDHKTIKDSTSPMNSCRSIFRARTCYDSLPGPYLVGVENCLGSSPQSTLSKLLKKEQELHKKVQSLSEKLKARDEQCSSYAPEDNG